MGEQRAQIKYMTFFSDSNYLEYHSQQGSLGWRHALFAFQQPFWTLLWCRQGSSEQWLSSWAGHHSPQFQSAATSLVQLVFGSKKRELSNGCNLLLYSLWCCSRQLGFYSCCRSQYLPLVSMVTCSAEPWLDWRQSLSVSWYLEQLEMRHLSKGAF